MAPQNRGIYTHTDFSLHGFASLLVHLSQGPYKQPHVVLHFAETQCASACCRPCAELHLC
eukprot:3522676-Amphidinium_carterae.1